MIHKHVRMFRTALFAAYIAMPLAMTLGTYLGWLFQSSTPSSKFAVVGLIALMAATMFAEYTGEFERAAGGRDVLKGIAYWLGAIVWVAAVVRLVTDSRTGATVLIGPLSALILGGVFHLSRFAGTCTRSWTAAIMAPAPMPMAPPNFGSSSSKEIPAWSAQSTRSVLVGFSLGHKDKSHASVSWTLVLLGSGAGGRDHTRQYRVRCRPTASLE
jgi:hypothetical protein